jgi:hypothetical protein
MQADSDLYRLGLRLLAEREAAKVDTHKTKTRVAPRKPAPASKKRRAASHARPRRVARAAGRGRRR